jgi:phage terminase large subunit GpA-like protein
MEYSAAAHRMMASALAALQPPPDLKPSVWAERSVYIPVGNAIPGLIRFDNAPYQREPLDMTVDPSCQRISLKWAAQVGKAVALETLIPTPRGFVPMGEIVSGDTVFDEQGKPSRVRFATEPMLNRSCYKVVFDDQSSVICDEEHLWTVVDRGHRIRGKATNRTVTLSTGEMLEPHHRSRSQGRARYSIPNSRPVEILPSNLPIDPYLYGVWLGDGTMFDGTICFGRTDEIIASVIADRGFLTEVRYRDKRHPNAGSVRVLDEDGRSLAVLLGRHGLKSKAYVSQEYLFAHEVARRDLLAGLLDTDGTVDRRGQVEFVSKSEALADAVFHLAASLGIKPRHRVVQKSCFYLGQRRTGSYHLISFKAYPEDDLFRLPRKRERLARSQGQFVYSRQSESRERRIVSIDPVPSAPVKCIQVDSPNSLYLVGRAFIPTHNTQVALCAQSYRIAMDPTSQLMMQPSEGDLQTWLQTKFNPLVEANPELESRIATARGRKGVNNTRMKSYPGGFIMFAWSGSPKTQRGKSAPFVVADETDGYDRTAEGHPVSLLWQRAATFGDMRKLLEISTPTVRGLSWIDDAYEQGDQRQFHVGCPHCGEPQVIMWSNVKWEKDADGAHLPMSAYYECSAHGCVWSDSDRVAAVRHAEKLGHGWKAQKPFLGHASYHLSELYSCFRRLGDIVQSFLEKKASDDLQTFVNVSLAECWEEEAERVAADDLMARAESWGDKIPAGVACLTAGIDMQEDRLELELVGWGLGEESWSIDYQVFWGDPMKDDVWELVFDFLAQTYETESGATLKVSAAGFDTGGSGGLTQAAYEQLRGKHRRGFYALKGGNLWGKPVVSAPSKSRSGRRTRPVMLFSVGVNDTKLTILRRANMAVVGPGYCHFPIERDPEFFLQLTAEQLVTKMRRGFPVRAWHKTRERNEALDCRVYAYAALKIANPNLPQRLSRLAPAAPAAEEPAEEEAGNAPEEPKRAARNAARQRRRRRTSGL